jgi:hypothetical protein
MNRLIFIITGIVFINMSCENGRTEQDESNAVTQDSVQRIDINDLVPNTIPLHELTEEQVTRVKEIHEIFNEVNPNTLEEWVDGFEVDLNPDSEIDIWLNMGQAYADFTANNELSLDQKMEAYEVVLLRSLMNEEEVLEQLEQEFLSTDQILEILESYKATPKPIPVIAP